MQANGQAGVLKKTRRKKPTNVCTLFRKKEMFFRFFFHSCHAVCFVFVVFVNENTKKKPEKSSFEVFHEPIKRAFAHFPLPCRKKRAFHSICLYRRVSEMEIGKKNCVHAILCMCSAVAAAVVVFVVLFLFNLQKTIKVQHLPIHMEYAVACTRHTHINFTVAILPVTCLIRFSFSDCIFAHTNITQPAEK